MKTLRAFFLARLLREKVLLTGFVVMVAAVGASFPSSRRAVRLDPVTALRCD